MTGGLVVGFGLIIDMMAVDQCQVKKGSCGPRQNGRCKEGKLFVMDPYIDLSMGGQGANENLAKSDGVCPSEVGGAF